MEVVTVLGQVLEAIETQVVALGTSPWLLLAVAVLSCIDGFFPPVPSESIVIAAASLAVTAEGSALFLLLLVVSAAVGAYSGDLIAYAIGARVPIERLPGFRRPRGRAMLDRTQRALIRNGTTFILAGRFIPVGRVAVNLAAGVVGFPRLRFRVTAAGASLLWAAYSVAMGLAAGYLLRDNPLIAMVVGVAVGTLTGFLVDRIITYGGAWLRAWRDRLA